MKTVIAEKTNEEDRQPTLEAYEKPTIEVHEIEFEGTVMSSSNGGYYPRG